MLLNPLDPPYPHFTFQATRGKQEEIRETPLTREQSQDAETENKTNPSVLFVTRSYPPVVGGMEMLSYNLTTSIGKITKTRVIANTRGKKYLPVFVVTAFFEALSCANQFDIIHIGDPVLSKLAWLIKKLTKKPVVIEVHGLDILYKSKIYQWYLSLFFRNADSYICISNHVQKILHDKFSNLKSIVITPGVHDEFYRSSVAKKDLQPILGFDPSNKKIILTTCRLVERKGVAWFVEHVMPKLPNNMLYIIAGRGPEQEKITHLIKKLHLEDKVYFVGGVSKENLALLYNSADIFIMPNIAVSNDAEGFGLVALEASSCGTPVIASPIEGITDAVIEGKNGWLAQEKNPESFSELIMNHIDDKQNISESVRQFVLQNYNWQNIAQQYLDVFKALINK
jgi:glycosyltransferase involved in cell wall biosynthesis